jgi:uroporphyrinogen-III synthase
VLPGGISKGAVVFRTLPPLRLVLLVGPEAASTIEQKLKNLEAEIQVPVRYITASTPGALREAIPGPIAQYGLIEDLIGSSHVVD